MHKKIITVHSYVCVCAFEFEAGAIDVTWKILYKRRFV